MAFVLSLFVPHLSFFWSLGIAVLRGFGISGYLHLYLKNTVKYKQHKDSFVKIVFYFLSAEKEHCDNILVRMLGVACIKQYY